MSQDISGHSWNTELHQLSLPDSVKILLQWRALIVTMDSYLFFLNLSYFKAIKYKKYFVFHLKFYTIALSHCMEYHFHIWGGPSSAHLQESSQKQFTYQLS